VPRKNCATTLERDSMVLAMTVTLPTNVVAKTPVATLIEARCVNCNAAINVVALTPVRLTVASGTVGLIGAALIARVLIAHPSMAPLNLANRNNRRNKY